MWELAKVQDEMKMLPDEQRRCLEMKMEGYSYEETAQSTGLSLDAVNPPCKTDAGCCGCGCKDFCLNFHERMARGQFLGEINAQLTDAGSHRDVP